MQTLLSRPVENHVRANWIAQKEPEQLRPKPFLIWIVTQWNFLHQRANQSSVRIAMKLARDRISFCQAIENAADCVPSLDASVMLATKVSAQHSTTQPTSTWGKETAQADVAPARSIAASNSHHPMGNTIPVVGAARETNDASRFTFPH